MALNQTLMEIKVIGMILNYLCTKSKHAKLLFWSPQKTLRCVFCAPVVLFQDNFFNISKSMTLRKKCLRWKLKIFINATKVSQITFLWDVSKWSKKLLPFFSNFGAKKGLIEPSCGKKLWNFFLESCFIGLEPQLSAS